MTEKSNTTRKILALFLAFFIVLLVIKFMLIHSETLSLDPGSRTNETMYKWQHSLVLKSLFIFTFFITLLLCGVELFKQKIISGKDYIQILFFSSITFLIAFINFNYKSMNYIQMFSLGNIDLDQLTSVWIHYLFFDKPFLGYYAITSIILLIILFLNGKKHVYGLINIPIILTYLLVNYDYVLIGCRYFLIPLVSLGTLSVVGFYITGKQRLPVFLQLYPVILVLITASIFKQEYITNTLYSLNVLTISYMIYLVIVFVNHFLWQKSKMNIIISHLLPFWFLASVFFGMNRYHHSTNVHMVLSYILSLPHFFYQDLVFCILLAGITIIIFHILKKLPRIRNISSIIIKIISFILIILIYVDYRTTSILGVRMTWSTFTSADDPAQALKLISHYMSITTVFSMIFLPFLFFSLNYGFSKKHILKTKSKYLLWLISAIVFLSPGYYFLGDFDYVYPNTIWNIASTSPITKILTDDTMSKEYFTSFSQKNNLFPTQIKETEKPVKLNVVLIIMESMHCRYLSLFGYKHKTQPYLEKFKDKMELFTNFYSNFPGSLHARFSTLCGMYSSIKFVSYLNPQISVESLFEILKKNGYSTSLFYSSFRTYTGLNRYLKGRKIDIFHDCKSMPADKKYKKVDWGIEETQTLAAMKKQLNKYSKEKNPFFMTYIPCAPHFPYDQPHIKGITDKFNDKKNPIRNKYLKELLYMDWIFNSFLEEIKRLKLMDKTLIVFVNDHGEEVAEEQIIGHGWRLDPQIVLNPLIIMNPLKPGFKQNTALGSQIDVMPTILDILNIEMPSKTLYQGCSLYKNDTNKNIFLTSLKEIGFVEKDTFYQEKIKDYRKYDKYDDRSISTYEIQTTGKKTTFNNTGKKVKKTSPIKLTREFMRFQEEFIKNYSYYKSLMVDTVQSK